MDTIRWPEEETVEWLRSRVSVRSGYQISQIDPDESLASYGLTSLDAITLTAELEDALRIRIEPTVVWEYPSISSLVKYLYRKHNDVI